MFPHLRVASGYSFQYGASHPSQLVERAAELSMPALALTDRDGLYGAVRFAKACLRTGVAPIVGVDLAVGPPTAPRRPTAARGGQVRDERLPRVVVTATSRSGWGTLCELITVAHLHGERSRPVVDLEMLVAHCAGRDVLVTLGADSTVGALLLQSRLDDACREAARWQQELGRQLVIAATNQHVGGTAMASAHHAAGMLRVAELQRIRPCFTNLVRMARREQATTVDVLDAARRRVPLDLRNIDRRNAEGYLKSAEEMEHAIAEASGMVGLDPQVIIGHTRGIAEQCVLDPVGDIGLGEIRLPEFEMLGTTPQQALGTLRQRCEAGIASRYGAPSHQVSERLDDELATIGKLGFESYFLTVADVVDLIRHMGIRCAARGSGAGSLVNYLLGISGVEPLAQGLIMERFLSPLRQALPDIDIDVESERRTEIYDKILATFGGNRVSCMTMLETYRVRHAVRDVGAALSLPPMEIDAMAKAFPHIRARDARAAMRDLPELRAAGLAENRLAHLFTLVESLDALPRHVALHPCGVILSDSSLRQRTPLEASHGGFPMSQFDKDDVEDLGMLKLDILGIRMQSSMAHAVAEIERTKAPGPEPDLDALAPFDDERVYDMIAHRATLGCFQIESPGQRELVGKFGPENFADIIIDISLFRPGPVKSDMITPFLAARQGWEPARYLHPRFRPALEQTRGVVVFHEQLIQLISIATGCTLAQGDEARRALGDVEGQAEMKEWLWPRALAQGFEEHVIEELWEILSSFASFGFCKAHAAAFALPTYQSAWLKRHYPAHFIAGILTHDPGMYPKRLLLEEARRMGVEILGLDVNRSQRTYRTERVGEQATVELGPDQGPGVLDGLPQVKGWGIRLSLADVAGMSESEAERIVAGQPYASLSDLWARAKPTLPVAERLVLAGGLDSLYGIGRHTAVQGPEQVTRRDLLLTLADLHRIRRADQREARRVGARRRWAVPADPDDPSALARVQKQGSTPQPQVVQGALDFDDADAGDVKPTGLPEMDPDQRLKAELEILGLDASQHIMGRYIPFLKALGATSSRNLLGVRNRSEILLAGVKVATQTPPVRSGRRVVFLTLDDSTGPADATFFEDAQGPYAGTVFNSWMLLVRGVTRRTGPRGISVRATGAWDLGQMHRLWQQSLESGAAPAEAIALVRQVIEDSPRPVETRPGRRNVPATGADPATGELVEARSGAGPAPGHGDDEPPPDPQNHTRGGGMGRRRVLVHASGFKQSPYADIKPAGTGAAEAPRKLWHSSPGSSGR